MSLYQSIRELRQGNHRRHPSPAKHGRRLVVEALEGRTLLTTLAFYQSTSPVAGVSRPGNISALYQAVPKVGGLK
jgi:hypothetical protein